MSYVADSRSRAIYFLEIGDAPECTEEEYDEMTPDEFFSWHVRVGDWKSQPLDVVGPFCSVEAAEAWMQQYGAYEDDL